MTMLLSTLQNQRCAQLREQLMREHPNAKRIDVWWKVNADFSITVSHSIEY